MWLGFTQKHIYFLNCDRCKYLCSGWCPEEWGTVFMQYAWCDHFGITLAWEFPRGSRFEVFVPSCPVISRQTLLSDEGALSLATSGKRRMAVSTACLTQSTVVICPDTEIILINQRCRPLRRTLQMFQELISTIISITSFSMRLHIWKSISCILITDWLLMLYYRLVSLVSSVKLVLSLSSLCSLLISKCILSGSLNQHQ